MPANDVVTDRRRAYLRAHGRNTRGYVSGRSVAEQLAKIAIDTHIIFNNNSNYAPSAAARLQRVVAGTAARA
jgi:hypothetical protein